MSKVTVNRALVQCKIVNSLVDLIDTNAKSMKYHSSKNIHLLCLMWLLKQRLVVFLSSQHLSNKSHVAISKSIRTVKYGRFVGIVAAINEATYRTDRHVEASASNT